MQYGFRTKTGDEKIDNVLLSLQGKERSRFIREALSFYIDYKDIIKNMQNDILDIKQALIELKEGSKNEPKLRLINVFGHKKN